MDVNFDAERGVSPHDCGSDQDEAATGYGDRIERRRPALARSAYVGILAVVFSFTAAATLSASQIDSPPLEPTAAPLASLDECSIVGLIEGPSIASDDEPATAEEPTERLSSTSDESAFDEIDGSQVPALAPAVSTQAEADQWGQAALALVPYPWAERLPGWEITFHPPQDGLYGLTLVSEKRIEIYLREGETQLFFAHVIAHEIGHAVDVTYNDGPDRRVWSDAREIESAPWWPGDGATDFSTGAGDFAEAFAAWQVGSDHFRSNIADSPTPAQVEILELLAAEVPATTDPRC